MDNNVTSLFFYTSICPFNIFVPILVCFFSVAQFLSGNQFYQGELFAYYFIIYLCIQYYCNQFIIIIFLGKCAFIEKTDFCCYMVVGFVSLHLFTEDLGTSLQLNKYIY